MVYVIAYHLKSIQRDFKHMSISDEKYRKICNDKKVLLDETHIGDKCVNRMSKVYSVFTRITTQD
ncbi:hypothetical protein QTP88_002284 [Uroleucon formosanum]